MPHVELPQVEFKVVVLGDTNTGKTSLVVRFVSGHYQSHDIPREPTIGAFFVTKRMTCVQQNMTCKLLLWDTAGQEQYTKFASTYYQNAAAAIVTYDISQPQSIQRLSYWLDELHRNITVATDRRIVLCVAACKCDVMTEGGGAHHRTTEEAAATQPPPPPSQLEYQYAIDEGKRISEQYSAIFVNTSAKENMGISFLFEQLCHRVLQYQYEYEMNPSTVVPIPVTVVSTTTSNGVQSPTHNAKQHHPKRIPTSTSPNHPLRKNVTTTTTSDTRSHTTTTLGALPAMVSTHATRTTTTDESDSTPALPPSSENSMLLSTPPPLLDHHHHDDTILVTDHDDDDDDKPYAVPTNLSKSTNLSEMDDRSHTTHTTHTNNNTNHRSNNHPSCHAVMCGDTDAVTAFVCGSDRNPSSSCQIM